MTRVLVVEDEESFSDAISYMLRKEGFEVAVCPTGPDALETFDRSGADLVLLDLMLPGLPGSEVCRTLRERSNVPVIMLTAKDSEIDKVVGLELGADDYVTKPFSSRELVARMRAVLRRRGDQDEPASSIMESGPVRMDVDRHVVTVRSSTSRSSNSFSGSCTCSLRTVTTCRSTSIRTGPDSMIEMLGSSDSPRRLSTARILATSSREENGLVT